MQSSFVRFTLKHWVPLIRFPNDLGSSGMMDGISPALCTLLLHAIHSTSMVCRLSSLGLSITGEPSEGITLLSHILWNARDHLTQLSVDIFIGTSSLSPFMMVLGSLHRLEECCLHLQPQHDSYAESISGMFHHLHRLNDCQTVVVDAKHLRLNETSLTALLGIATRTVGRNNALRPIMVAERVTLGRRTHIEINKCDIHPTARPLFQIVTVSSLVVLTEV